MIAMLMIALMIISIGALMNRAVTYYKHEPWEEYLTLIGNIELSSHRLVELSLSNYTNTQPSNSSVLRSNLQKWQTDLTRIYPGYGVSLNYTLADGLYTFSGTAIRYSLGMNYTWQKRASFSVANASFDLNINSIGLSGHKFLTVALLNLTILSVNTETSEITVTVKKENGIPLLDLEKEDFQVAGLNVTKATSRYDEQYVVVYVIKCAGTITLPVTVTVWDSRGIKVTAKYP